MEERSNQGWSPAVIQSIIDDDHCRRVEEAAVLDADDSARVFLSSFAADEELEMLSVSLRDPASFVRMTTPCRSFRCSHLQCVDRDVYQQLNAATEGHEYYMKCHVCNELRNPDKLYIDFVTLVWLTVFEKADYVHVHRDGRFELFDENRRKVPCTHVKRVAFVQVEQPGRSPAEGPSTELELQPADGTVHVRTLWDLKHVLALPDCCRRTNLWALSKADAMDVTHLLNTATTDALDRLWRRCTYDLSGLAAGRPYHSTTYEGLKHAMMACARYVRARHIVRIHNRASRHLFPPVSPQGHRAQKGGDRVVHRRGDAGQRRRHAPAHPLGGHGPGGTTHCILILVLVLLVLFVVVVVVVVVLVRCVVDSRRARGCHRRAM